MATNYRQADFIKRQFDTVIAETTSPNTATGIPIPSTYLLTADGSGGTIWRSHSTIYPYSTFRTVKGNSATTFSADLNYNTLQVSTTGVRGTFESYVDSATSTLMLSNAFPPIGVTNVTALTDMTVATASNLPGGLYMAPVDGNSTMKFIGVGDIKLSTVTAYKTTFVWLSSFTSVGYSSISGELAQLKRGTPSTFSTLKGQPSFVSSITSNVNWRLGSQTAAQAGGDMYISTCLIENANLLFNHVDTVNSNTKLHIDYYPNVILGVQSNVALYPVSTYLANPTYGILSESVVTGFITSQNSVASGLSNYYTAPVRMAINPYTSLSNIAGQGTGQVLQVIHRIVGGSNQHSVTHLNNQSAQNSLFISMTNSGPNYTAPA
jgi:hypothetical protein